MTPNQLTEPAGIKPFEILAVDDSPEDTPSYSRGVLPLEGKPPRASFLNGVEALDHFKNGSARHPPGFGFVGLELARN